MANGSEEVPDSTGGVPEEPSDGRGDGREAPESAETTPESAGNASDQPETTPESAAEGAEDDEDEGDEYVVVDYEELFHRVKVSDDPYEPRQAIADALQQYLTGPQILYLINEILAINKTIRWKTPCDNCGHMVNRNVEIPDAKAVVSALTDLLTQGYGRPGEAKIEDAAVTFQRLTNLEAE